MAHRIANEIYFELHRLGLAWQRCCRNPRFWVSTGVVCAVALVLIFLIWAQINFDERLRLLHRTPIECSTLSDPAMVVMTCLAVIFAMMGLVAVGEVLIWFDRNQAERPVSMLPMLGYSVGAMAAGGLAYGMLMRLC